MSDAFYYKLSDEEPSTDSALLSALSEMLSEALNSILKLKIKNFEKIEFESSILTGAAIAVFADFIAIEYDENSEKLKVGNEVYQYYPITDEIKLGDDLYKTDVFIDTILTNYIITTVVSAIVASGVVPGSPTNILLVTFATAGVIGYTYSKFVDPVLEDVLTTISGKDMIQFFDSNGEDKAGLVFPPPNGLQDPLDAIKEFIGQPSFFTPVLGS